MSVVSNVYLPIYIKHTFPPFSFESDIMQTLFTKFNLEFAFFDFTLKFDMHFFYMRKYNYTVYRLFGSICNEKLVSLPEIFN